MSIYNYSHLRTKKKLLNILIIDDDVNISSLLKQFLELRGHSVKSIQEGIRGITQNNDNNYDLIFIDFHLDKDIGPNLTKNNLSYILDGSILSELIINSKSNNKIIFGYTGDSNLSTINKFKDSGVNGVLFKPFDSNLLNKVMNAIENNPSFDKLHIAKLTMFNKNNIIIF
jgi:DNA-binding response OmpR family regulator